MFAEGADIAIVLTPGVFAGPLVFEAELLDAPDVLLDDGGLTSMFI